MSETGRYLTSRTSNCEILNFISYLVSFQFFTFFQISGGQSEYTGRTQYKFKFKFNFCTDSERSKIMDLYR